MARITPIRGSDGANTLAREFVWGKWFPDQGVMIDYTAAGDVAAGAAEALYHLHGVLGNVIGLANANGSLVEKYECGADEACPRTSRRCLTSMARLPIGSQASSYLKARIVSIT